jgi:hypothetical protein
MAASGKLASNRSADVVSIVNDDRTSAAVLLAMMTTTDTLG